MKIQDTIVEPKETPLQVIEALWEEYSAMTFPARLSGRGLDGVDFVHLDMDIAGCVSTFLITGNLDVWRTAVLGLCCRDAGRAWPVLYEEGRVYFWRLEHLAEQVLREVARRNRDQQ